MHLDTALSYASRDLHVFPLLPRCKAPDGSLVPHGVKQATVDASLIRRWWNRSPEANIGIAIGHGTLFGVRVLDVDPKNGGDHELARLVALHGALPSTPTQRSGSGGVHMLFRWPSGDWKTKVGPGVEILGPGRYFVAAPSIHPSGARYEWTSKKTDIAPCPAWLLEISRRRDIAPRQPTQPIAIVGARYARGALMDAIRRIETSPDGERNNELNRQAFSLSRFVRSGELGENLVRRALADAAGVAGLSAFEADQTISSALRARKAAL